MELDKVISERFSVRNFKPERVKKEHIDKILKAGHLAPTGCNYQPQRILVINSESAIEKLKGCTKCHFNAPTAFLVCHNIEESWVRPYDGALSSPVDAVIVATHMMLKAQDLGVGCCWVMHFNPELIKKEFNLPDGVIPQALLVMGYASSEAKPLAMHEKVKDINEVVFYDTF
ncbi:MAG: nitroreductase family protein [Clostridia bacterium]|nr:nitroreductase family protein [Clostridia bacterium]